MAEKKPDPKHDEAPEPVDAAPADEGTIARAEVVAMIDEILRDSAFTDAEGRRRLADLSNRISARPS